MSEQAVRVKAVGLGGLVLPTLVSSVMTALVAGALFVAPASPLAMGVSEADLGLGSAADAAEAMMQLGRTSPRADLQRAALERAAQIYALELQDPRSAQQALKLVLATLVPDASGDRKDEARLRERIAELMLQERNVADAAQQYKRAWLADPSRPELLARAGDLQASIGNSLAARQHYRELRKVAPEWAARANLGLGEVALTEGNATAALRPFQNALRGGSDEIGAAARLGLAACYERLGELEGALAELERTDLPDSVRERRKAALRKRADDIRND